MRHTPPVPARTVADFIVRRWATLSKIVEVGVGRRPNVAQEVQARLPATQVLVTDTDPASVFAARTEGLRAVLDDVFHPKLPVHEGAGLLYSMYPAPEMVPALVALGKWVHADVFITPLDEDAQALGAGWTPFREDGVTVGWLRPRPAQAAALHATATSPRISQSSA